MYIPSEKVIAFMVIKEYAAFLFSLQMLVSTLPGLGDLGKGRETVVELRVFCLERFFLLIIS